jgi:hypothetical protein
MFLVKTYAALPITDAIDKKITAIKWIFNKVFKNPISFLPFLS